MQGGLKEGPHGIARALDIAWILLRRSLIRSPSPPRARTLSPNRRGLCPLTQCPLPTADRHAAGRRAQSEAGYIDARPLTAISTKHSCDARPDHTLGQSATKRFVPSMSAVWRFADLRVTAWFPVLFVASVRENASLDLTRGPWRNGECGMRVSLASRLSCRRFDLFGIAGSGAYSMSALFRRCT